MAKYIDRDKLITEGWSLQRTYQKDASTMVCEMKKPEDFPAADVAPRWIPVTERLPEEPFGCLVTVWDTNPISMDEFENLLPYFVGWDGEQWNDGDGEQCPFEVIAWMPLPSPYKEGEQNE